MSLTLGFDIYGTLIDPHGVVVKLEEFIGERAVDFSNLWRSKQLEFTFRKGLMRKYENFPVCTRQALDYTDTVMQTGLSDSAKQALMDSYRVLPAFDDVVSSLETVSQQGHRLFGFSNGTEEAVQGLLEHAGIDHFFEGVVSVDSIQSFKPDPAVYHYFLKKTGSVAAQSWLVSSNPFDIIGAVSIGMKGAWLKRAATAIYDPWGVEPTKIIDKLADLSELPA
ncbi:MAG: 2-haloacid dehalogenase [Gammaproteobacteria bacterium]|jgi:2-haloacid dehalogenase